jgi:uncharacterized membrane protein AbrB (regulator of aidB expression)
MTITAKAMSLDVSLIAAFHFIRIVIVISTVPLAYSLFVKYIRWKSRRAGE